MSSFYAKLVVADQSYQSLMQILAPEGKIRLKSPPMDKPTPASSLPPEITKLSFEEALSELEKHVRQLEDGKAKLDDAIGAYERGTMLKQHCETKLREAQAKIAIIADGGTSLKPFNTNS